MTAGKDEPSWRKCEGCDKDYFLPIGYDESCPEIRGLCMDCISLKVRGIPLPNDEKATTVTEPKWL